MPCYKVISFVNKELDEDCTMSEIVQNIVQCEYRILEGNQIKGK